LDINGKIIPWGISHKGTQDFKKKWDGSIKRGCRVEFTIKTLYLLKHVSKLCFIQQNHVNQDNLHVHGDFTMGDRFAFATHLSQKLKNFVMEQLRLGLIVSQIMAKHRQHVKNIMLRTCELNRNMFLTKQKY
jgi:hypothetical protein